MNADYEQGLANYLTAAIATAALANAVALAATNDGNVPNDKRSVICKVKSMGHLSGALYKPMVDFIVSTPAKTEGASNTLEDHKTFVTLVRDAFDMAGSGVVTAVDAAMQSAASMSLQSWFIEDELDAKDTAMWQTTIPVRMCSLKV